MAGATIDGATSAKKPKTKIATNEGADDDDEASPTKAPLKKRGKAIKAEPADAEGGDADEDEEATPVKAAPKKRGKAAIKVEPAEAEAGDADTEATPAAESPKKGRTKKATGLSNTTEANGDAANNIAATTEVPTTTPKRKRGPNKPKDPNATPAKRAKKGAINNDNNAANAQPHANQNGSIFGGDANVKMEEDDQEDGDDRPLDASEQKMADDTLFGIYTSEEPAV